MHELNVDEKVSQVIGSKDEKYTQKQMVEDLKLWEGVSKQEANMGILVFEECLSHTHTQVYIYICTIAISLKKEV